MSKDNDLFLENRDGKRRKSDTVIAGTQILETLKDKEAIIKN